MKRYALKFASVAALAAGMAMAQAPAAPADAAHPRAGRAWAAHKGARMQRMAQALNLTDTQKEQAKAIFQQAKQNAQPLAQQLKQNREALAAAVKANDSAQIHSLAAQQGTLRGQMLAIRSEAMAKLYTTLTPEQKAKADQMHQNMKSRMQSRKGNNG
jgi:Spy/CpxP family protein refolding chaperone